MEDNTRIINFERHCYKCKNNVLPENSDICDECLSNPALESTSIPLNYEDNPSVPDRYFGYYKTKIKQDKFLYSVKYDDIDYDFAMSHYKKGDIDVSVGGCSSFRKGNMFGRNLDWFYNKQVEFIVKYGDTVGMCGGLTKLTTDFVNREKYDDIWKILPFQMYDGINKHGLVANMNVVPTDYGYNKSVPKVSQKEEVCGIMLIRYILDKFETAKEAVEYIRDYVSVYFGDSVHKYGYELHYMIADKNNTYILEIVNNEAVILDVSDHPYMTNFYIFGVRFNPDGSVFTPETQTPLLNAVNYNYITEYGSGLERYNMIVDRLNEESVYCDIKTVAHLLCDLRYTRSYKRNNNINIIPKVSDPYWYTEFVGNGVKCNSDISKFNNVIQSAKRAFINRSRDTGVTWHTTHSVMYDLDKCEMYLATQEASVFSCIYWDHAKL